MRRSYHTRQKAALLWCLEGHRSRYLTVREIEGELSCAGQNVGPTTLYRNLERMVESGEVLKFVGESGEARYCLAPGRSCGQLVCLDCGTVQWLDCTMLLDFSAHVRARHGFEMVLDKSMLLGHCGACVSAAGGQDS